MCSECAQYQISRLMAGRGGRGIGELRLVSSDTIQGNNKRGENVGQSIL